MTVQHDTGRPPAGIAGTEQSKPAQVAERAGAEASNVASTAAEGAREVTAQVADQAGAVATQARQQFDQLVGQARTEFRQQAQGRSDQAANGLRTLSQQLTALAEGRPEGAGSLVGYLQDAGYQARTWATRLEQRGPQGVIDDLSSFARRRPGLFLAGAAGIGFFVGRAVRAGVSSQQEQSETKQPLAAGTYQPASIAPTGAAPTLPGDGASSLTGDPAWTEPLPPPSGPEPGIRS
jgi:hypothetical protein